MLKYIDINKIHPHPDNPRKELGDLTELADSIRSQGILQNLTVVPWFSVGNRRSECTDSGMENEFTAVIGHRRHAAAKLAGLTEVPCIVSDMSYHDQVATMLLENMQRNDLTIYEQAQGFQMMLNFGDTVESIADRTGFSKQTVRHRVKLLELDQPKLKTAMDRGASIQDYIELEKIKNVKTRNKVLELIGTRDFKWKLDQAIEEEARPERKKALVAELNKFAKPVKESGRLSYVSGFYGFKMDNFKIPKDAKNVEYFYVVSTESITLYKKEPKAPPKQLTADERSFKEREAKLRELAAQAYESRYTFIKELGASKKQHEAIVRTMARGSFGYMRSEIEPVLKLLDIEKPEDWGKTYVPAEEHWNLISDVYNSRPDRVLLILAYARFSDSKSNEYYNARGWENKIRHSSNRSLDILYDFLIDLGYEMSEEEIQLRCGTHELFDKEASNS
jgi:ParB family transcriptional regulator, chromosome partitioning protein